MLGVRVHMCFLFIKLNVGIVLIIIYEIIFLSVYYNKLNTTIEELDGTLNKIAIVFARTILFCTNTLNIICLIAGYACDRPRLLQTWIVISVLLFISHILELSYIMIKEPDYFTNKDTGEPLFSMFLWRHMIPLIIFAHFMFVVDSYQHSLQDQLMKRHNRASRDVDIEEREFE